MKIFDATKQCDEALGFKKRKNAGWVEHSLLSLFSDAATMNENGNGGKQSAAEALLSELESHCESDLLSEEGLRELIERHGFTSNNDNALIRNYEFFFCACYNERVDEGIIRCLLEYFPDAGVPDEDGTRPLHVACLNGGMTRGVIQLLIDAAPDSVRSVTSLSHMPLHVLCDNEEANETETVEILKLLIEKYPEAVRHADNEGYLPIHVASASKSPQFCQVLIEEYPGSERIANAEGFLPPHFACWCSNEATIDYLYNLHPDAIKHASTDGYYPIHCAIVNLSERANREGVPETVRFLLNHGPNVILQKYGGMSLLHFACQGNYNDSNIDAALDVVKAIYDAHPEEIKGERIVQNLQHYHQQVQAFINSEMLYARQAEDGSLMTTPDCNGQLPLHAALQDNVRLGSIKLLVKGNPTALQSPDNSGALPLHIACQHHESASVVGYMIGLDTTSLDAVDQERNTALHCACRGARYDIISFLLDKFDAVSVSKRNADKKLPIDLLWESNAVEDSESVEYIGSVFRLLKAYPETLPNAGTQAQTLSDTHPSQSKSGNGKKRKFGNVLCRTAS